VKFTDEDIRQFVAIWQREFGEMITDDKARLEAGLVMELYWALVQPLPDESGYNESLHDDAVLHLLS
jgi:hypothetical protein